MNFRNFCRYLVGSCRLAIDSQLRILAKITSAYGYRVLLGNDDSRTRLASACYVTAIKWVPKFQLGNPDDEAPASRDGKLELPALNSQAGAWELAPITSYGSQALRGNDELVIADPILAAINPLIGLLLLILAGCSHQDQDRQTLRPVNVIRITSQQTQNDRPFPGEVRARFETTLSFRVAGKLINRSVDMGDRVRKGQMLARLDPSDYRLASQSIKAQLIAAKADRKYSQDDLSRYRELFNQNIISRPELDRHQTLDISAQQKVAALEARLGEAGNQLAYTDLRADRDGVVTALEVEAGQVVAPGQPVIRIAQLDEKEIPIDIPEHRVTGIDLQQEVAVTLWADGDKRIKARIREIAAAADSTSRTYRVKVTLLEGRDDARLGMTATVWIPSNTPSTPTVPLSAVFTPQNQPEQPSVWLVDERTSTVKAVPVRIGDTLSGERVAITGLAAGQLIVSAGANRLVEGQPVRLPHSVKPAVDANELVS